VKNPTSLAASPRVFYRPVGAAEPVGEAGAAGAAKKVPTFAAFTERFQ
jgi:hypothetical protein